jgi:hypothetical protein
MRIFQGGNGGSLEQVAYEETRTLYSSPRVIRVINSRRMGLAEHVERIDVRTVYIVSARRIILS